MNDVTQTDAILRELILLDPSLAPREDELRSIIAILKAEQPLVAPDAAFIKTLRERLILGHRNPVPSPYATPSWWAVRLIPLGAVALLVLMVLPERGFDSATLPPEIVMDERGGDMNDVRTTESEGSESGSTMSFSSDAAFGTEGGDSPLRAKSAPSALSNETVMGPLMVSPQTPGIQVTIDSVTTPVGSYIAIYGYRSGGEEFLAGVSPYILPGTTTAIPIYLRSRTRDGELYRAVLQRDNGNRVFTEQEDYPIIGDDGTEISVTISIIDGR
jgi:hypothetical protein